MKNAVLLLTALVAISASALIAGPARVTGKIKSFDDKLVTVEGESATFQVPREYVAEKNMSAGQKIEILLSLDQAAKVKVEKSAPQAK